MMAYQKKPNLLENAPIHPSKSGGKNLLEINDGSSWTYSANSQT